MKKVKTLTTLIKVRDSKNTESIDKELRGFSEELKLDYWKLRQLDKNSILVIFSNVSTGNFSDITSVQKQKMKKKLKNDTRIKNHQIMDSSISYEHSYSDLSRLK